MITTMSVDEVVSALKDDGYMISVHSASKNGISLTALTLETENNVRPTIYFEDYKELPKEQCLEVIKNTFEYAKANSPALELDEEKIIEAFTLKNLRAGVCKRGCVTNNAIHREFLDLEVYLYINMDLGSVPLSEDAQKGSLLSKYSDDTLFEKALENSFKEQSITDIGSVLNEIYERYYRNGEIDEWNSNNICSSLETSVKGMYVLSNPSNYRAAIGICNNELLSKFADEIGADLYICPSSIHEIILVDANIEGVNKGYLHNLVKEVNIESVDPRDKLSDSVYFFSRKDKAVTII